MVRTLLIRGMLAGLVAGLLVFAVGRLLGEPPVGLAIAFEAAADEAKPHTHDGQHAGQHGGQHGDQGAMAAPAEAEPVSRGVQSGIGLLTAVTVYGTAFGGLFALVFATADRRLAPVGPRATAALLAALGFVSVYLVPGLKYPANPPAVGLPDTIGHRTALFFVMLGISVAAMVAAAILRTRLVPRLGAWNATLSAGAAYLVAVTAVATLLPAVNEVPDAFPAVLLWQFRLASAAMQLTLWTALGLVFGVAAERALAAPAAYPTRVRHVPAG